ncbi:tigger transposable element derived 5 isoform X1 [Drosophila ficusphila]|uniref:tigger transposable element derived 5 isoform X1 n=1 Tax=Drosophila ficusphila TaxID=30025 RepID=UPI001C8AA439|nr:tigger transposable element derived 5 isoform X1 [Drosophila ficusphila]
MSSKRKCFSVEEKMQIIRRLEAGERNATLAKEFGVCHTTIATIKKNKEKIKTLFYNNVLKPKRVRASIHDQVDKALLQWFIMQSSNGIPLRISLLQEKANFFAKQFKIENFNCSASWISRFKVRHNIVAGPVSGEFVSVQKSDDDDMYSEPFHTEDDGLRIGAEPEGEPEPELDQEPEPETVDLKVEITPDDYQLEKSDSPGRERTSEERRIYYREPARKRRRDETPIPERDMDDRDRERETEIECDLIGKRMATHFRQMKPDQRLFAERIISEVLVYGRMDRLSFEARFVP